MRMFSPDGQPKPPENQETGHRDHEITIVLWPSIHKLAYSSQMQEMLPTNSQSYLPTSRTHSHPFSITTAPYAFDCPFTWPLITSTRPLPVTWIRESSNKPYCRTIPNNQDWWSIDSRRTSYYSMRSGGQKKSALTSWPPLTSPT